MNGGYCAAMEAFSVAASPMEAYCCGQWQFIDGRQSREVEDNRYTL